MSFVKTSELTGPVLDWAVAKCEGHETEFAKLRSDLVYVLAWKCCPLTGDKEVQHAFEPSTNWAQGGPIIEREGICIDRMLNGEWIAVSRRMTDERPEHERMLGGTTPLIAAMRCYVARKLGDKVEIPEELVNV